MLKISARNGAGMDDWVGWLLAEREACRRALVNAARD
jgi:hypothetical protein